jgi:hypothetical protein
MTKNEIITNQRMLFPAITVCNYNLLRKSKQQEVNAFVKSAFSSEEGHCNLKNERDVDIDKMYHMFGRPTLGYKIAAINCDIKRY